MPRTYPRELGAMGDGTVTVVVLTGPAHSGKTGRVLTRYRIALGEQEPESTLWLSPTWRSASATRDRLISGGTASCFSPGVMTFDQLAEAILQASPVPVRPLSRLLKRQLVRRLLDDQIQAGRIQHFLPIARTGGLVDQICEFTSELKRLDVWPDRFRQACRQRGMTDRDAELWGLYDAYQQVLNEHNFYDAEGRFWSARKLLREGRRRPLEHLRLVAVDGFTDFTPPEHEILQLLSGWVDEILITLPLEAEPRRTDLFSKPLNTLKELRRRHGSLTVEELPRSVESDWPSMAHLEASLFGNPRERRELSQTTRLEILAASRRLGEIELVGSRIKRLLTVGCEQSGGRPVRPGEVAVVFRSVAEAEELIREVFGKLGIPVVLESGCPLGRAAILAALVGLIRLDVEDWPFRHLLAVLSNNYFQPDWPERQDGRAAMAAERAIRSLQIPQGRTRLLERLRLEADQTTMGRNGRLLDYERCDWSKEALPLLVRLQRLFDAMPQRASLGQWRIVWQQLAEDTGMLKVMEDGPATAEGQSDDQHSQPTMIQDQQAWKALQEALSGNDRLCQWLGESPPELDRRAALGALLDTLGSVRVRQTVDESGRVRILSAASVRALRVPYLFFAGLAERSFPPPERQDRLYGDVEYRQLIEAGLPLVERTQRNREEMLLFYEAMTRAEREICFSYPALDDAAQPLAASPYLDEVEQACGPGRIPRTEVPDLSPIPTHDEPLTTTDFRIQAVYGALQGNVSLLAGLVRRENLAGLSQSLLAGLRLTEARRDRKKFGPSEGMLESAGVRAKISRRFGPRSTFSPTSLEQYATCPYRFFAEHVLRLESLENLTLAVDYRARGKLVHDALADFHQRVNRHCGGPASPASLDSEEYERLLQETLQLTPAHEIDSPLDAALHEVDRRLWANWAADYCRQHRSYDEQWGSCDAPLLPTWFEVSFGQHGNGSPGSSISTSCPLELSAAGEQVRIAGRIDRIDTGTVDGQIVFNVLDYKTGGLIRLDEDTMERGTSLQLPLYVIATQELLLTDQNAVPWRAGYWYVREKGFRPKQSLKLADCEDERVAPTAEWEETRQRVIATVGALAKGVRGARFPVYSSDEFCTRSCQFRTICRINHIRSLEKTWHPVPDND